MEKGGRERRRESDAIFSRLLSRPPYLRAFELCALAKYFLLHLTVCKIQKRHARPFM